MHLIFQGNNPRKKTKEYQNDYESDLHEMKNGNK